MRFQVLHHKILVGLKISVFFNFASHEDLSGQLHAAAVPPKTKQRCPSDRRLGVAQSRYGLSSDENRDDWTLLYLTLGRTVLDHKGINKRSRLSLWKRTPMSIEIIGFNIDRKITSS